MPCCRSTHPDEIMVPLDIIMMLPDGGSSYRNPCLGHKILEGRPVFFFFNPGCKMPFPEVPSVAPYRSVCAEQDQELCKSKYIGAGVHQN